MKLDRIPSQPDENFLQAPSNGRAAQMSDDKTETATERKLIDVYVAYELLYWSRRFGVTGQELLEAVQKVGTHPEDVAIELGRSI